MEEHEGTRINIERVREALAQQPETICVACPYCMTMFEDGLKDEKAETVQGAGYRRGTGRGRGWEVTGTNTGSRWRFEFNAGHRSEQGAKIKGVVNAILGSEGKTQ